MSGRIDIAMSVLDGSTPSSSQLGPADRATYSAELKGLIPVGASVAHIEQRCPKLLSSLFIATASTTTGFSASGYVLWQLKHLVEELRLEDERAAKIICALFAIGECDHLGDTQEGYRTRQQTIMRRSGYDDGGSEAHYRAWYRTPMRAYMDLTLKRIFTTKHPQLAELSTTPTV